MSVSRKKVVIRRFSRDWVPGYLPPAGFVSGEGAAAHIELLDLSGRVISLTLAEIKMVSFVREFNPTDPNPERLLRKTFVTRPRGHGLWLRLTFRDNDVLEGLAANDLTLLESAGLLLTPPDTRSNTQRVYVPRAALSELQVVASIGNPIRRKITAVAEPVLQEDLFSVKLPPNSRPN